MISHKLKFILLPQLIAALNNYACSLPPLVNVKQSAFPEWFCQPCKSMTGEMAPKKGSNLAVRNLYGSHCQCTSVQALYWNIGPLWVHVQVIATLNSTVCAIWLLCLSFFHHSAPPAHFLIYTGPILINKIYKKFEFEKGSRDRNEK